MADLEVFEVNYLEEPAREDSEWEAVNFSAGRQRRSVICVSPRRGQGAGALRAIRQLPENVRDHEGGALPQQLNPQVGPLAESSTPMAATIARPQEGVPVKLFRNGGRRASARAAPSRR